MKNITIDRLTIRNFKGTSYREIVFGGRSADIKGANRTGKTTILDAWLWLLFDKDSTSRTDFSYKPIDEQGDEIHSLDTEVTAVVSVDGVDYCINKRSSEKWVKKRGQLDSVYAGNEKGYLIDGVPKSAGEFKAFIGDICGSDGKFRLITTAGCFMGLAWTERRTILNALVSEVDCMDAVLENSLYDPVRGLLEKHSLEDAKKSLAYSIKELKKELETVPVRIDEAMRSLEGLPDELELKQRRDALSAQLGDLDDLGGKFDLYAQRRGEIMSRIGTLEREKAQKLGEAQNARMQQEQESKFAIGRLERELADVCAQVGDLTKEIDAFSRAEPELQERLRELRQKYAEVRKEVFDIDVATSCPVCGQALPAEQLAGKRQALHDSWVETQKRKLADMNQTGRSTNASIEKVAQKISGMKGKLTELKELESIIDEKLTQSKEAAAAIAPTCEVDTTAIDRGIKNSKDELNALQAPDGGDAIAAKRQALRSQLDACSEQLGRAAQREALQARVDALRKRQTQLGVEISALEGHVILLEQITTARCEALQSKINALFPTVTWKLFDRQINGGIADCCECLIGGVPFADANNAAKINANLEIIKVLSSHFEVCAPVFVDNAEAVNALAPLDGQRIALVVTNNKELNVEVL